MEHEGDAYVRTRDSSARMMDVLIDFFGASNPSELVIRVMAFVGACLGLSALVWKGWRKSRAAWQRVSTKANRLYESLAGSDEIIDPETGEVLRAARAPMGQRVGRLEAVLPGVEDAMSRVATALEGLLTLEARQRTYELASKREHEQLWTAIGDLKAEFSSARS